MGTLLSDLAQAFGGFVVAVLLLGAGMALALMAGFSGSSAAPVSPAPTSASLTRADIEAAALVSALEAETIPVVQAVRVIRDNTGEGSTASSGAVSRFISARQYMSAPSVELWNAWWAKPVNVRARARTDGVMRTHTLRLLICEPPHGPMLN